MQIAWFGDLCVQNKIRPPPFFYSQFHVINCVVRYHIHIGINCGVCMFHIPALKNIHTYIVCSKPTKAHS